MPVKLLIVRSIFVFSSISIIRKIFKNGILTKSYPFTKKETKKTLETTER